MLSAGLGVPSRYLVAPPRELHLRTGVLEAYHLLGQQREDRQEAASTALGGCLLATLALLLLLIIYGLARVRIGSSSSQGIAAAVVLLVLVVVAVGPPFDLLLLATTTGSPTAGGVGLVDARRDGEDEAASAAAGLEGGPAIDLGAGLAELGRRGRPAGTAGLLLLICVEGGSLLLLREVV